MLYITGKMELPIFKLEQGLERSYVADTGEIIEKNNWIKLFHNEVRFKTWDTVLDSEPEPIIHRFPIDEEVITNSWEIKNAVGEIEYWESITFYGEAGYMGSQYRLTTFSLSSCNGFQTVYITCIYKQKGEMRTCQGWTIMEIDDPTKLITLMGD